MEKAAYQEVETHKADYGARGAISGERWRELKLAQEGADEKELGTGVGLRGLSAKPLYPDPSQEGFWG